MEPQRGKGGAATPCTHDEALLRSAAESLDSAGADARESQSDVERALMPDWTGQAGDSFRKKVAVVAAELAALTAGIVGLGILVSSVQREAADCAVASAAAAGSGADATAAQQLPWMAPGRPLLPQEPRGPLLPQEPRGPLLPYQRTTTPSPAA